MKKDFFAIIIALMIIALVGIIGIQLLWLRNAVEVKQAQTDNAINEVLTKVVDKIETNETITIIADSENRYDTITYVTTTPSSKSKKRNSISKTITINSFDELEKLEELEELGEMAEIEGLESLNGLGKEMQDLVEEIVTDLNISLNISTDEASDTSGDFEIESGNQAVVFSKKDNKLSIKINQFVESKKEKVGQVMERIITENIYSDKPVVERIDTKLLIKDIRKALINKGLKPQFDMAIIDGENDSILFADAKNIKDLLKTKYKTELFPNDILEKDLKLYLNIKNVSSQVYKSIMLPLVGSILFILIILIVFIVAIVTIHNQKKISEIKSDFINNMTHEFKTPIATISLAVDSIDNDKVISEADKVKYFTQMIREENNRMNYQVENVLQASLLDKNDLDLYMVPKDVSSLITKAVNNIRLQVEQREGTVTMDLSAENHHLNIDEIHFTNVINNLLDNANKYSSEAPQIEIKTINKNDHLIISISDKGIGMNKDVRKKIFDKFYRQTHGNIHNVKGFGLGLSYVSAIVSKLKGSISVESKEGQGSVFTIKLPNYNS